MTLHVLPDRTGSAAENMALDFLLLQRYPEPQALRFRHYNWHRPAFTFGYSQKIAWVSGQLPPGESFDLCRRPTGGGVVDHRQDWTYALILPRGHPWEELPAPQSYRGVHECLATALRLQAIPAGLKPPAAATPPAGGQAPGVCFQSTEIHDVIHELSGEKIAGGAQKRNKHGLLFQGSIAQAAAGPAMDWDRFHADFTAELARALSCEAEPVPWPDLAESEVEGLIEQYAAPEWTAQR